MWKQSAPPTPQSVDASAEPAAENGIAHSFSNVSYFIDCCVFCFQEKQLTITQQLPVMVTV